MRDTNHVWYVIQKNELINIIYVNPITKMNCTNRGFLVFLLGFDHMLSHS